MPSTRRTLRGVRPRTIDTKRADGSRLFRWWSSAVLIQNLETHELKAALRVYRRWMRTSPRTTPERKRGDTAASPRLTANQVTAMAAGV